MEEEDIRKTSEQWKQEDDTIILDPDGWDRCNFDYSWSIEMITYDEYLRRRRLSTTSIKGNPRNRHETDAS